MSKRICVILTCHNRAEMTERCICRIVQTNPANQYQFVVTDDLSTDDTVERLERLQEQDIRITVLHEKGEAYYCGGMRRGIFWAKGYATSDYFLLVNDDVTFYDATIDQMVAGLEAQSQIDVLVGATCNTEGDLSYGGIRYDKRGIHYQMISPKDQDPVDTFNANCVLLRREVFLSAENIDSKYIHTLGDFDYGLAIKRSGKEIRMFESYVGECNDNATDGGWQDRKLSTIKRLKAKETVKGAPFAQWFYFLYKNFGLWQALLHGFTPYVRILLHQ